MHREKFNQVLKSVADVFRVLSHPDRIRLVGLLHQQEMDVTELHEKVGISQSSVSQHLKLLKMNHLVEERREGRHVYYHLKNPDIIQVVMVAIELQAADHQQEGKQVALYKEMHALWAADYDDAV
ncbi:MAG: winged helix-turn-helix transcriptional regulator [Cyanobacteria bacterium HKST-UBA06]|nr:winged helix-turn-helix transcriptional regulator [Cyanobacteria bacterium HKST-UBA06]